MGCEILERERARKILLNELKTIVSKLTGKCRSPYDSVPPREFSHVKDTKVRPHTAPADTRSFRGQKCQCSTDLFNSKTFGDLHRDVDGLPLEVFETIDEEKECITINSPQMLIAYRLTKPVPLNKSKSRELRGSILYLGCDCEKRNGLQDDCPRSECQSNPLCLLPQAKCGPSAYAFGKHLGLRTKEKPEKLKYQCYPAFVRPCCTCTSLSARKKENEELKCQCCSTPCCTC